MLTGGHIRKVSGGFFMLNLLFGEEPGEGDDVRVDFFARVGHGGGYDVMRLESFVFF